MTISDNSSVHYIGCDDLDLDLFENQYILPEGMAYNSYLIDDDKIAVVDTIDARRSDEWQDKLKAALAGRAPQYLIVQHLEPDHSANIEWLLTAWPECQVVCTAKAAAMLPQFFDTDFAPRTIKVKDGDTLDLGQHRLQFITAPMVHWPEVMVTYDATERILFSADAFGKFGAISRETDDWACEARRYYFNIVGKYGAPVQTLLKKAAALDIQTICPLHGPVLTSNLGYYLGLYDTWSSYKPETRGVFIAYATLHGHTRQAAEELAAMLRAKGETVAIADLSRADMAECVEDAFRYDRIVLAASSYDAGVHPKMAELLHHLKAKAYQKRTAAVVENGSWAPCAARVIKAALAEMKDITVVEPAVTIRTRLNAESRAALAALAAAL